MVALPSLLSLTRRQWAVVVVVGLGIALVNTPSLAAAVGYAIGSVPLTYLVVLAVSRLIGSSDDTTPETEA